MHDGLVRCIVIVTMFVYNSGTFRRPESRIHRVVYQTFHLSDDLSVQCYGNCQTKVSFNATGCEGEVIRISCPSLHHIVVSRGVFGRLERNTDICSNNLLCLKDLKYSIQSICRSRDHCVIDTTSNLFSNPCDLTDDLAVDLTYSCERVAKYTTPSAITKPHTASGTSHQPISSTVLYTVQGGTTTSFQSTTKTMLASERSKTGSRFWINYAFRMLKNGQLISKNKTHLTLAIILAVFLGFAFTLCLLLQCNRKSKPSDRNNTDEESSFTDDNSDMTEFQPLMTEQISDSTFETCFTADDSMYTFCNETPSPDHEFLGKLHGLTPPVDPFMFPDPPKDMLGSTDSLDTSAPSDSSSTTKRLVSIYKQMPSTSKKTDRAKRKVQIIDYKDIERKRLKGEKQQRTLSHGSDLFKTSRNKTEDILLMERRSMSEAFLSPSRSCGSPYSSFRSKSPLHRSLKPVRDKITKAKIQKIVENSGLPIESRLENRKLNSSPGVRSSVRSYPINRRTAHKAYLQSCSNPVLTMKDSPLQRIHLYNTDKRVTESGYQSTGTDSFCSKSTEYEDGAVFAPPFRIRAPAIMKTTKTTKALSGGKSLIFKQKNSMNA